MEDVTKQGLVINERIIFEQRKENKELKKPCGNFWRKDSDRESNRITLYIEPKLPTRLVGCHNEKSTD